MYPSIFIVLASITMRPDSPMVFLFPDDLEDATGVVLSAFAPEDVVTLLEASPDRPGLWYTPVAALPSKEGTRVWYQRVEKSNEDYSDQRTLCVGTVRDGTWSMPDLHPEPPSWGGPNNVVMRRSPYPPTWGGFNVFQIVQEDQRLRMLYWDQPESGLAGAMLASSTDGGYSWEKDPRGTVFTEHNDAFTLLPMDGRYVLYQTHLAPWPDKPYADNLDKRRRVQSIRFSGDLVHWTPQEVFLAPDENDPPATEFYLLKAFPYGGAYAGLLMKYYGDPERPKQHSGIIRNELIVSRDARNWERPFRDTDTGFWTYADPFTDKGKTCFAAHYNRHLGLFRFRPHRLTGVVAEDEGSFITPPLEIPHDGLVLNADASSGEIDVEVLAADKSPIEGEPHVRITGENVDAYPLDFGHWSPSPANAQYRLKVTLRRATLYSIAPAQ